MGLSLTHTEQKWKNNRHYGAITSAEFALILEDCVACWKVFLNITATKQKMFYFTDSLLCSQQHPLFNHSLARLTTAALSLFELVPTLYGLFPTLTDKSSIAYLQKVENFTRINMEKTWKGVCLKLDQLNSLFSYNSLKIHSLILLYCTFSLIVSMSVIRCFFRWDISTRIQGQFVKYNQFLWPTTTWNWCLHYNVSIIIIQC